MDIEDRAQAYAEADFLDVNETFVDRLAELADFSRPALAVDLGTGPADIALMVASRASRWRAIGIDMSLPMLHIGQGRRRESKIQNASLILADAKSCPFPDATFDVVYSNSLLHHVASPDGLWREIRRIAKPGATIFVRDLFRPHDADAAYRIVEQYAPFEHALLKEDFYNSLLAAYTAAEVRAQLEASGLGHLTIRIVTDRHMDIFGTIRGA